MCRNVRSIEWHQKTYHEISWDYTFNAFNRYSLTKNLKKLKRTNGLKMLYSINGLGVSQFIRDCVVFTYRSYWRFYCRSKVKTKISRKLVVAVCKKIHTNTFAKSIQYVCVFFKTKTKNGMDKRKYFAKSFCCRDKKVFWKLVLWENSIEICF
jgi:hypothetical protein